MTNPNNGCTCMRPWMAVIPPPPCPAHSYVHSCNCMYGSQDPRCCINRTQRQALEEAWRLGREGKPLPGVVVPEPPDASWIEFSNGGRDQNPDVIKRMVIDEIQPSSPDSP